MIRPPADKHRDVWRKATRSGPTSGDCVEVASRPSRHVAVRDSKDPHGPVLAFNATAWSNFVEGIKDGAFTV